MFITCLSQVNLDSKGPEPVLISQVPGDGVLVEGHSLSIDESTMTGESNPVSLSKELHILCVNCLLNVEKCCLG